MTPEIGLTKALSAIEPMADRNPIILIDGRAGSGKTFSREQLANADSNCRDTVSNARTIDVHIRRLRAKLPGYEDIVRTVRGTGYRYDKHPDVLVES